MGKVMKNYLIFNSHKTTKEGHRVIVFFVALLFKFCLYSLFGDPL